MCAITFGERNTRKVTKIHPKTQASRRLSHQAVCVALRNNRSHGSRDPECCVAYTSGHPRPTTRSQTRRRTSRVFRLRLFLRSSTVP
ncbi:unnamed protein product [Callosobruchus maculatus]|uniref:Uncharacterized protein n=1 Tax=Callosobruchus maculatus TaxID=64391 RepID=A0A653CKY2_CALMS|nr:unnamed protein product [Callosobruchus maculatus]